MIKGTSLPASASAQTLIVPALSKLPPSLTTHIGKGLRFQQAQQRDGLVEGLLILGIAIGVVNDATARIGK